MKDSVVQALGRINHTAIMDLMAEVRIDGTLEKTFSIVQGVSLNDHN